MGPTSHSFISQRTKLHYVDWGNPEAPPLLLIHGGRDHCRNWDWIAEELRHDWHIIAPDMRGHGDSEWSTDGNYSVQNYIYDIAQLVHQKELSPVTIVSHSMGGNIALRYTGLYPEKVRKLVAIEGLGPSPKMIEEMQQTSMAERWRKWIDEKRAASARTHRKYETFEDALARMKGENKHLSDEQALHLTIHAVNQNEDGTFSWKFDPHMRVWGPFDLPHEEVQKLWGEITCPTLLCYGEDSWASNPEEDGRIKYFNTAKVKNYKNAGHWLHHDQFEEFLADLKEFL
ncbi:alpha/beta fold hydrolase [Sneathiella sp. P13V-1]|uniref:alpha/beta fold hydrolase n=1 Tax=Sneathiella sp. P13V-1 TaxID=2697366 RepID=UPI00187B9523|nr:alpha/beta hydrolase [Sneathiella sp. P13V-1]MBE7635298.1 alpha/beta fold hydrolase [Sneathiella sp. P13V-1]